MEKSIALVVVRASGQVTETGVFATGFVSCFPVLVVGSWMGSTILYLLWRTKVAERREQLVLWDGSHQEAEHREQ